MERESIEQHDSINFFNKTWQRVENKIVNTHTRGTTADSRFQLDSLDSSHFFLFFLRHQQTGNELDNKSQMTKCKTSTTTTTEEEEEFLFSLFSKGVNINAVK
jgi:hypothetical protein